MGEVGSEVGSGVGEVKNITMDEPELWTFRSVVPVVLLWE